MADNKRTWDSVEVDLSEVKKVEALHAALNEAFEFPEYYGGNLDALHDCLTDIAHRRKGNGGGAHHGHVRRLQEG